MRTFLVGIAGGTASGKTTIARELLEIGGNDRVILLELDRYYRSQHQLTPEQRAAVNYDHPDVLEFGLLIQQLKQLRNGDQIHAPFYDFTTHCRDSQRATAIEPRPIIIVEGILIFSDPKLRGLFDLRVFVDTPEEVRFARRLERDTRERGRSPESVHAQWQATVQPMHLEFCEPGREIADIVINGQDNSTKVGTSLWDTVWKRANGGSS